MDGWIDGGGETLVCLRCQMSWDLARLDVLLVVCERVHQINPLGLLDRSPAGPFACSS